jgi:hypothetical protein
MSSANLSIAPLPGRLFASNVLYHPPLLAGNSQLGWSVGRNLRIDYRWGGGDDRFRKNAAELVALAPDVILAVTSTAAVALQRESRDVPIVLRLICTMIKNQIFKFRETVRIRFGIRVRGAKKSKVLLRDRHPHTPDTASTNLYQIASSGCGTWFVIAALQKIEPSTLDDLFPASSHRAIGNPGM